MNSSDYDAGAAELIDIELIMQEVRRRILERKLPGQVELPRQITTLPPEYYEYLYRAGLAQSRMGIRQVVVPSPVPIIGSLIDRLRAKFHELVIFYVGQIADQQAEINNDILRALSVLGMAEANIANERPPVAATVAGPSQPPQLAADQVTLDDVIAGYRLLIGREPDASERGYWSERVAARTVSRHELVRALLDKSEDARPQHAAEEVKKYGN